MKTMLWAILALVSGPVAGATARAAASDASTATIPIQEYLDLKKGVELPSLTTIEEVELTGVFGKSLKIAFGGSGSGQPQAKDILQFDESFGLHDCKGDALMHIRDGRIAVLPLAKRFRLTCEVTAKNWSSVELTLLDHTFFHSLVSGADAIVDVGGAGDSARRRVLLAPTSGGRVIASGEVTAVGRYDLSVLPEETRFQYSFLLSNPNRAKKRYDLKWKNGEIVQSVKTSAQYDLRDDGSVGVDLVPGENVVTVSGTLKGAAFSVPLASPQQYLLIQNHPMLQLAVKTDARRISPRDSGLTPTLPSARAFLVAKGERATWEAKKLDVFSSAGYSVSGAQFLYYVPESATPVIEARYQIDNQGANEIALPVAGTPTYLAINGAPAVLSKDSEGRVLIPVSPGRQEVLVQYQPLGAQRGLASVVREDLARPASVLSNVDLTLALAPKWQVLVGSGLQESRSDFTALKFGVALAAFALAYFLLGRIGLPRRRALVLGLAYGGMTMAWPGLLPMGVLAAFTLALLHHRARVLAFMRSGWKAWAQTAAVAVALLIVGSIASTAFFARFDGDAPERAYSGNMLQQMSNSFGNVGGARQKLAKGRGAPQEAMAPSAAMDSGEGAASDTVSGAASGEAGYQGLPARIVIPTDVRAVTFHQGMLDDRSEVKVRAYLVSENLVRWLVFAMAAIALFGAWRSREAFRGFARL
jgi:hypothetical protein